MPDNYQSYIKLFESDDNSKAMADGATPRVQADSVLRQFFINKRSFF